jgi:hypothetical protein
MSTETMLSYTFEQAEGFLPRPESRYRSSSRYLSFTIETQKRCRRACIYAGSVHMLLPLGSVFLDERVESFSYCSRPG